MLFNIDEKQLMLELKNKDERALKICMNKYYRYVVYIVENIIGSALPYEDKEEVVSNVFVALWNYSADLDTDNYSTFKPYLGTIARNMAKNALRKTSKMHFENYEDAFQVGTNEHIEYGPLKEEVIKCLKESIYELSVDERKCFISYYYYTKTIAVIAEETGLKESTVKSKLLRGRKKLKVNYSATELPEHLKSGGIPPFSGCVHDTNTACLSAMQLLLLFLEFLVRLRTVFSFFRIRKDISAGY